MASRRTEWSSATLLAAMPFERPMLLALTPVRAKTLKKLAIAIKASPNYADHMIRSLCSRGLARRKANNDKADSFVITERGIAYRNRLRQRGDQRA